MHRFFSLGFAALILGGCASASVSTLPLSGNVVSIRVEAARVCGLQGVRNLALKHAAVATIRGGFDRFFMNLGQGDYRITGTATSSSGSYGAGHSSSSTTSFLSSPFQTVTVEMFKNGESEGANALDARNILGPKWQEVVKKGGPRTCT